METSDYQNKNSDKTPIHSDKDLKEQFLAGEIIEAVCKDVSYQNMHTNATMGTLTVTNYKLYFKSTNKHEFPFHFDLPLCTINRLEKFGGVTSKADNSYGFELYCKDLRNVRFVFSQENHSRRDIIEKIQLHAFALSNRKTRLFAFESGEKFTNVDIGGWQLYDAVAELKRMGITAETWRITQINERYGLCDSYPQVLAVPATVPDADLRSISNFRCKNRLPVLSWIHRKTQATITRTSQPQVGVSGKRSKDDELYLQSIIDANAESSKLFIMDARPLANAVANKARGGGTESEDVYSNAEIIFLDIPNIHVIRESLKKVKDLIYPKIDENRFLTNLEQTNWLKHIKLILNGAIKIAEKIIKQKSSVLVHCSDGWDRTAQLTSLAMILLDPFYRTIRGFEILIEKEWLSFGHKFQDRIGHGEEEVTKDRSPVFLQFIDCVFQVKNQFSNAFEFREQFLIDILDHLYSCRFGTFLCNNEKERNEANLKKTTESLWSFMNSNLTNYKNPFYFDSNDVIFPLASQRSIVLWKNYYFRWSALYKKQNLVDEKCHQLFAIKEQLEQYLQEKNELLMSKNLSSPK